MKIALYVNRSLQLYQLLLIFTRKCS